MEPGMGGLGGAGGMSGLGGLGGAGDCSVECTFAMCSRNGVCQASGTACDCFDGWQGTWCDTADLTVLSVQLCEYPASTQHIRVKPSEAGYTFNASLAQTVFSFTQELRIVSVRMAGCLGLARDGQLLSAGLHC